MHFPSSLLALILSANGVISLQITAASFNIRFANTDIGIADPERLWNSINCQKPSDCRINGVLNAIQKADQQSIDAGGASLIGLQEVLDDQREDMLQLLNGIEGQQWATAGVARDDGESKGEFSPIIYRTDVWNLVSETTKWLSETPDVPSNGFGATEKRIVTLAVMEHKATGKRVLRANCHLDNASADARLNGVRIVVDQIKALQAAQADGGKSPLPVILTGDFNSGPGDGAYQEMVKLGFLEDAFNMVGADGRTGGDATFTGFSGEFASRIDFVWMGPRDTKPFTVNKYAAVDNINDGLRFSDHKPVVVDATLA